MANKDKQEVRQEAKQLESLLELSQSMLACAKEEQWQKLPDIETKRQQLMYKLFENKSVFVGTENLSTQATMTIEAVLAINTEIEQFAQQQKVSLTQKVSGLKKKQNVHSAYLENK